MTNSAAMRPNSPTLAPQPGALGSITLSLRFTPSWGIARDRGTFCKPSTLHKGADRQRRPPAFPDVGRDEGRGSPHDRLPSRRTTDPRSAGLWTRLPGGRLLFLP